MAKKDEEGWPAGRLGIALAWLLMLPALAVVLLIILVIGGLWTRIVDTLPDSFLHFVVWAAIILFVYCVIAVNVFFALWKIRQRPQPRQADILEHIRKAAQWTTQQMAENELKGQTTIAANLTRMQGANPEFMNSPRGKELAQEFVAEVNRLVNQANSIIQEQGKFVNVEHPLNELSTRYYFRVRNATEASRGTAR